MMTHWIKVLVCLFEYVCVCFSTWEPTWYGGHYLPYCTSLDDGWLWLWSSHWSDWQGKLKCLEKTFPIATFSSTKPIWPDLGSNLGHHGWQPATNHLIYGMALFSALVSYYSQCIFMPRFLSFGTTCILYFKRDVIRIFKCFRKKESSLPVFTGRGDGWRV